MRLTWDGTGEKIYENGTKNGVLYPINDGTYAPGIAWNGLTGVTESPSGAEATALYADDIKYANLLSAEEFAATIEAYTYPDEFKPCNGEVEIADGISVGQQSRQLFGMSYRTAVGNDTEGNNFGYKIHVVYGCFAAPSEKGYKTINDSPEAITFSWEISTTPVPVTVNGEQKTTATLIFDSTKLSKEDMKKVEDTLYGTTEKEPTLLLPDEFVELLEDSTAIG